MGLVEALALYHNEQKHDFEKTKRSLGMLTKRVEVREGVAVSVLMAFLSAG